MSTDRIERVIILRAPQSRVWGAISDSKQFGEWFNVSIDGAFTPGTTVQGRIKMPGFEHLTMELAIEQVVPERLFSFRWHPYAIDPNVDYSAEPMTLVEFRLAATDGGTHLTVVESGFDGIPIERRAEAFRMDNEGWTEQVKNIEKYVAG